LILNKIYIAFYLEKEGYMHFTVACSPGSHEKMEKKEN
jgi:hypothetical protein